MDSPVFVMKKVAVVALKGGVGKSSLVAGLGLALVDRGYKVGFRYMYNKCDPARLHDSLESAAEYI